LPSPECHILKLKCITFDFRGAPPQVLLGKLTALPDSLAGFKGPTSKGRERRKDGREGQGMGEERRG